MSSMVKEKETMIEMMHIFLWFYFNWIFFYPSEIASIVRNMILLHIAVFPYSDIVQIF